MQVNDRDGSGLALIDDVVSPFTVANPTQQATTQMVTLRGKRHNHPITYVIHIHNSLHYNKLSTFIKEAPLISINAHLKIEIVVLK